MLENNPQIVLFTGFTSFGFGRNAGPYKIASELRQNGFSVQVIEYFNKWSMEELKIIIKKFVTQDTLWVGISTTFLGSPYNIVPYGGIFDIGSEKSEILNNYYKRIFDRTDWPEIADFIKTINSKCKIVIGGSNKDNNYFRDNSDPYIDCVISGEGETSAVTLSLKLQKNKSFLKILSEPYKDYTNSRIKYEDNDIIHPGEHLPLEISRGCVFKCDFCHWSINEKKLWELNRKPESVREDIEEIYQRFGSTGFMFCDDTYNDSLEKVKKFHTEFIKLNHKIEFSTYARLDLIISKWETVKLLYESGLRSVFFGVESLNYESAKSIGKGMKSEKIKDGLYRLREECPDLNITLGMIIGLPYDTEETLIKNHEWFFEDDCPVNHAEYHVLDIRGSYLEISSKMSNNPNKYGYAVDKNRDGYWIRNDGFTFDNAMNIQKYFSKTIKIEVEETVSGGFYVNRLQNIGYNKNDFLYSQFITPYKDKQIPSITYSDIAHKENILMNKYKQRLMVL
jgi:hypothetical protein